MRILTLSSLYPNSVQPTLGLFVEQRLRRLVGSGRVAAEVLAPVPWFPFSWSGFGRYAKFAEVPTYEERFGISVFHPRYPVIPKVGMNLAPNLMAHALRKAVHKRIAAGIDFDLIDAHYFYPDGVAAAMLGRWLGKPVVITARGTDINVIARFPQPGRLIVAAADEAAAVITVSRALRDELLALGVSDEKIRVLRNGVDLEMFRPTGGESVRASLRLSDRVMLVVGHLTEGKGHTLALEALVRLPDTTLVLVGDGPLRKVLEEQARVLGVADRVRFCGAVLPTELPAYYSAADVLVLASEREGMPNVVLEALACGTPVVATAVGGIPEVVASPVAGILLRERTAGALAAAVTRLLKEPPQSESVRAYAEQYDWQPTTDGQAELFAGIVGHS